MINEELLKKLVRGECTLEELQQLQEVWDKGNYPELDELLAKQWRIADKKKGSLPADLTGRLWAGIEAEAQPKNKLAKRRVLQSLWAVAATVLLLIFAGSSWWWETSSTTLTSERVVVKNDSEAVQKIDLIDGTSVWLTRGSQLTYQQPFAANVRGVQLSGQGYFEVAKDRSKPFQIESNGLRTIVLGTAFNITAPSGGSAVEVALVEGSVRLEPTSHQDTFLLLEPGQQVTYSTLEGAFVQDTFTDDAPYAWKDGIIYFKKASVEEVARTLQDWYGIPFSVTKGKKLSSGRLVHRYDTKKLTLNEVLQGISTVMDYRFVRQADGSVLIEPKK